MENNIVRLYTPLGREAVPNATSEETSREYDSPSVTGCNIACLKNILEEK